MSTFSDDGPWRAEPGSRNESVTFRVLDSNGVTPRHLPAVIKGAAPSVSIVAAAPAAWNVRRDEGFSAGCGWPGANL